MPDQFLKSLRRILRLAPAPLKIKLRSMARILYGKFLYRIFDLRRFEFETISQGKPALFIDVSSIALKDHKTGIQRSTRNLFLALRRNFGHLVIILPVCATVWKAGYTIAEASLTKTGLLFRDSGQPIKIKKKDVFFALDFAPSIILSQLTALRQMKKQGMKLFFLLHDNIPLSHGEFFPPGTHEIHESWLKSVAHLGDIVCVSRTVRDETEDWLLDKRGKRPGLSWFHHGFTFDEFAYADKVELRKPPSIPYIITVSTIEPRKGHRQIIAAFEKLWEAGVGIGLVLVGQAGWKVEDLCEAIRIHPENGKRLFWYENCCDYLLGKLYKKSLGVLMASQAEGFGLAIIEGAAYKKPLLLRDIPVFREIAKDNAFYFSGDTGSELANSLQKWLELLKAGKAPDSEKIKTGNWDDSARKIFSIIFPDC